jgi:type I restriction enzyme S subunit
MSEGPESSDVSEEAERSAASTMPKAEACEECKWIQLGPQSVEIPEEWEVVSLSQTIATLETGNRPKTDDRNPENDDVLSIGGTHIQNKSLELSEPVYISEKYYNSLSSGQIQQGDILLVKDGATIGKSTIVDSVPGGKSAVNSHVYIIRTSDSVDSEYLYAYLSSQLGLAQILRLTTGSAQAGLNRTFIDVAKIPLPSLSEQRRIAAVLSTVDEQIRHTDEIAEVRQELVQGLIDQLVKIGVGGFDKLHQIQVGPKQVAIPDDWVLLRVDELVSDDDTAIRTGPFGSKLKKEYLVSEGIKVYEQSNVYDNDFKQGNRYITRDRYESELTSYDANSGDVLITLQGTIGDAAVLPENAEPGVINQKLMRVRVDNDICLPEYFALFFDESHLAEFQIQAVSHGAVVSGLNISTISGIRIPIPPLDEQQKIVDIVETSKASLFREQETKQRLQELKRGLMQDLLTGTVRVPESIEVED